MDYSFSSRIISYICTYYHNSLSRKYRKYSVYKDDIFPLISLTWYECNNRNSQTIYFFEGKEYLPLILPERNYEYSDSCKVKGKIQATRQGKS